HHLGVPGLGLGELPAARERLAQPEADRIWPFVRPARERFLQRFHGLFPSTLIELRLREKILRVVRALGVGKFCQKLRQLPLGNIVELVLKRRRRHAELPELVRRWRRRDSSTQLAAGEREREDWPKSFHVRRIIGRIPATPQGTKRCATLPLTCLLSRSIPVCG